MTEPRVIVRGVRKVEGLALRRPLPRAPRQIVGPRAGDPYWEEQGWTKQRVGPFIGCYRAGRARFEGRIDPHEREFLIRRPPEALRRHPHWICFRYRDDGWYAVHFAVPPRDMSSGIMEVERILNEALGTIVPNLPQPLASRAPRAAAAPAPTRPGLPVNPRPVEQRMVSQPSRIVSTRAQIRREIHAKIHTVGRHVWWWLYVSALIVLALFALLV